MTARTDLVTRLVAGLPRAYRVEPAFDSIANTDRPVVLVQRARVAPSDLIRWRAEDLVVWLLSAHIDPIRAEDDLDARLDVVLGVLDADPVMTWTAAERQTFEGSFHAYRITLETVTTTQE